MIVVAAGKGSRLRSKVDKPYVRLGGKPLLMHSLEVFQNSQDVTHIVLVAHSSRVATCRKTLMGKKFLSKIVNVVAGGKTRQDSVFAGLSALHPDCDTVLVHDAARPFVNHAMIKALIACAAKGMGAVVGMPVSQTIKKVDSHGMVMETPPRKNLWEIQTPQAFPRALLMRAHGYARCEGIEATDDAALVECIGKKVKVIPGAAENFKITRKEDLLLAEILLRNRRRVQ